MRRHPAATWILAILNVAFWLLAMGLLLTLGFGLAGRNIGLGIDDGGLPSVDIRDGGVTLSVPVAFDLESQNVQAAGGTTGVTGPKIVKSRGILRFGSTMNAFFMLNLAFAAGMEALLLSVIWELRGLCRALRAGDPFASANAARVRRIGWAVLLIQVGRALVVNFEHNYVREHFSASGLQFNSLFSVSGVIAAVIILMVAEVFRAGTQLAEEQRLTV